VTPGDAGSGEAALGMAIRVEADEESELVGVDAETAAVGCTLPWYFDDAPDLHAVPQAVVVGVA